jgi:hypothetical protein
MTVSAPDVAKFEAAANPNAANVQADEVKAALQALFPSAVVTDDVVNNVLAEMRAPGISAAKTAAAMRAPNRMAAMAVAPPPVTYYLANAQHARKRGTGSVFVGQLPVVRYTLPATGDFDTQPVPTINTAIGDLVPADRKIASVQMLAQFTDQTAQRVEILTAPRAPGLNARFAAVALYLCYAQATDGVPSFYILEAGTATGDSRVLFVSRGMANIVNQQTSYQPTPFSKWTNYYTGSLTMAATSPGEPYQVIVQSTDTSGDGPDAGQTPYIEVTLTYQKLAGPQDYGPQGYDPVGLTLQAAARVGLIGKAIGVDPGMPEDVAAVLAGWTLQWDSPPGTPPEDP